MEKKDSEISGFQLKTDFLSLSKVPGNLVSLSNVRTFALDLAYSPICLSAGSLIGDKFLTLATESIGIPKEREEEIPKQLYDLDNLLRFALDKNCVEDAIKAIVELIPIEAEYRNIKVDTKDIFTHMKRCLKDFCLVDTSKGGVALKKSISIFNSIYTRKETRAPLHGWASRGLRLNFFLECLVQKLENSSTDVSQIYEKAVEVGSRIGFSDLDLSSRKKMREQAKTLLLDLLKKSQRGDLKYKEFKGKPPERIYWQIVRPENVEDIAGKLSAT